jgi:hypothetical protein
VDLAAAPPWTFGAGTETGLVELEEISTARLPGDTGRGSFLLQLDITPTLVHSHNPLKIVVCVGGQR